MKHQNIYSNSACTTSVYNTTTHMLEEVPKKRHKTQEEAIHAAKVMNAKSSEKYKNVVYKCQTCGYYHIGRGHTLLTDEDRQKYKKALDEEWRRNILKIKGVI